MVKFKRLAGIAVGGILGILTWEIIPEPYVEVLTRLGVLALTMFGGYFVCMKLAGWMFNWKEE